MKVKPTHDSIMCIKLELLINRNALQFINIGAKTKEVEGSYQILSQYLPTNK